MRRQICGQDHVPAEQTNLAAASWSFSVHELASVAVTPEEMRAKALECESKLRAARDAGVVRMYTELASQWRELADRIERSRR
jgi:hypothetical protein